MPVRPARPALRVRTSSIQLVFAIALGVWLGFVLMLLTGWAVWHFGFGSVPVQAPATPAIPNASAPAAPLPAPSTPRPAPPMPSAPPVAAPDADEMFERYQQQLHRQSLRQAEEAARTNPANQSNPSCQFWLQQAQTAPTDESREQVARFCN